MTSEALLNVDLVSNNATEIEVGVSDLVNKEVTMDDLDMVPGSL